MQAVRYLSNWGYRSPGDVVEIPYRDAVILRERGLVEFTTPSRRYAATPLVRRSLGMAPKSLNEKERTISLIAATEQGVSRSSWDGDYIEILSCAPAAVRLERMNRGAALLDSHNYWGGTEAMLGSIVPGTARVVGKALIADAKFSRSEEGERAFQDAKDGVLRALSIGYLVHRYETDDTTSPPTRRAVDWEPYEVSAVAIPADSAAGFL